MQEDIRPTICLERCNVVVSDLHVGYVRTEILLERLFLPNFHVQGWSIDIHSECPFVKNNTESVWTDCPFVEIECLFAQNKIEPVWKHCPFA